MGRPELPLDPQAGPVAELAHELRLLRRQAGSPSYRELARRTNYSVTALSRAASGNALPSLLVFRAFVAGCGGDPDEWEPRWTSAAGGDPTAGDEPSGPTPLDQSAAAGRREAARRSVPAAAAWFLGGLVAGILCTLLSVWWLNQATDPHGPAAAASLGEAPAAAGSLVDGADPTRSGCGPDATTIARVPVSFPVPQHSGALDLRYSPHCHAAWARFDPDSSWHAPPGTVVTLTIIRPSNQAATDYSAPFAGQPIIGNLLLTDHGCLAAQLTMTSGSGTSPTASTACQAIGPAK
jgi:transcriptional regulator with XRE-family HTH domain